MLFLEGEGIPVAGPVKASDGSRSFEVDAPEGRRAIVATPWVSGVLLAAQLDEETARRTGALVGRLHRVVAGFRPDRNKLCDTAGMIRARLPTLYDMIAGHAMDVALYEEVGEAAVAALEALDGSAVPRGPTHGDIHLENVLISPDGAITLVDFDNCGEDFLAKELASFTWRNDYIGLDRSINHAFLKGYESERPLNREEREFQPLFVLIRNLFILTGHATHVNKVGPVAGIDHDLGLFAELTRRYAKEAGLMPLAFPRE